VLTRALETFSERISRPSLSWAGAVTAALSIAAGALIFDALTPEIISVGLLYVALILIGFWFHHPKASLVLALFATALIILGHWITMPDNTPEWQAWLNRALAIGTVWLSAVFVWHIRVLEQKLKAQIEIADNLSREIEHRVGNELQLVASFLRLEATASSDDQSRDALRLAGSRVMVIGNIQRLLSRSAPSHTINSQYFLSALIREVRSVLPDPDQIGISISAVATELTSTTAVALGALMVELINNAIKHAFPGGMKGTVDVSFIVSADKYILECEDDGVGIERVEAPRGFGTRNTAHLAHLLGGSATCQSARRSDTRPGTAWRIVIPH
jgi:two-component system, sensor histidine kinase PdtaS